jgi:hypothetical protein
MKMAQVEFLSVVYTVFQAWRAEPVLAAGETMEEGRERLRGVINDSGPRLTLTMNRPADLKLKWTRR